MARKQTTRTKSQKATRGVRKTRIVRYGDGSWRDADGFLRIGNTIICCRNGGTPMSENFDLTHR